MEALVVAGQADVLPDSLRVQTLTEMLLTIRDQAEVVSAPQHVPGQDVKLVDGVGERRRALDVHLLDPEVLGHLLWQNVLVDVGSCWGNWVLVDANNLKWRENVYYEQRKIVFSKVLGLKIDTWAPALHWIESEDVMPLHFIE